MPGAGPLGGHCPDPPQGDENWNSARKWPMRERTLATAKGIHQRGPLVPTPPPQRRAQGGLPNVHAPLHVPREVTRPREGRGRLATALGMPCGGGGTGPRVRLAVGGRGGLWWPELAPGVKTIPRMGARAVAAHRDAARTGSGGGSRGSRRPQGRECRGQSSVLVQSCSPPSPDLAPRTPGC